MTASYDKPKAVGGKRKPYRKQRPRGAKPVKDGGVKPESGKGVRQREDTAEAVITGFSPKQPFGIGAVLSPVPAVIVSCGSVDSPNAMTAAWTGTVNTIPPKLYISLRKERYSYEIIKATGEFVVNLTTRELVRAADYLGVRSGRNEDKLSHLGLSVSPSPKLGAPMLDKSPVSIECRVYKIIPLGSHDMFIADIVGVNVSPELIDESGQLRLDRAGLIAYCHGEYYALGEKLGSFGYSVRKKQPWHGKKIK